MLLGTGGMLIPSDSSFLAVVGLMGGSHSLGSWAALVQSSLLPVLGELSSLFSSWMFSESEGVGEHIR